MDSGNKKSEPQTQGVSKKERSWKTPWSFFMSKDKDGMQSVAYRMMGSPAGAKWNEITVIASVVIISILFFWTQSRV